MKKLELNQMENLEGGAGGFGTGIACGIAGAGIFFAGIRIWSGIFAVGYRRFWILGMNYLISVLMVAYSKWAYINSAYDHCDNK